MKKSLLLICVLFISVISSAQSDWGEVKWDNGLKLENEEKGYKL
jgi:hypothetical protein